MATLDRRRFVRLRVEEPTRDSYMDPSRPDQQTIDISVVMPCLNEEQSVGVCVAKAWEGIRLTGLRGEVIVSDNGSIDDSVASSSRGWGEGRPPAAPGIWERLSGRICRRPRHNHRHG